MKTIRLVGVSAAMIIAGCRTPPLYYWGNYEPSTYANYSKPGKLDLATQAQLLNEDLETSERDHLRVHPGLHAQLGYVYLQMERPADAREQFIAEKTLFPESTTMMDRFISKIVEPKT